MCAIHRKPKDDSERDLDAMYSLQKRLRKVVGCPVDWTALETKCDAEMIWGLRTLWKQTAQALQVDDEMDHYLARDFCERNLSTDIGALEANLPYWRREAEKVYRQKAEFLAFLKFEDVREKHVARKKLSREEVRLRSRKDSMFFTDVSRTRIEAAMWKGVQQAWSHLVEDRPTHIFVATNEVVGASEGQDASFVRFDFNYSNKLVHGHPRLLPDGPVFDEDGEDFPAIDDVVDFAYTIDDDLDLTTNLWEAYD